MKINKSMIKATANAVKGIVNKNAPQILAGVGVLLGVGAVCEAVHATTKAVKTVEEKKEESEDKLTKVEIVKATWKHYVPTACLAASSAACVIGSVHISMRRLASMTLAYTMSEKSFKEYKDKAKEFLGEKKEEELRGAIEQDRINANPPDERLIRRAKGGVALCLDKYSGQYFYSDADTIKRTCNELNRCLFADYFVSYNDYCALMDLEMTKFGDEWGWNANDGDMIEPDFTSELTPEGTPVLVVDFIVGPRPNFRNLHI